jgi:O-antigen/teichoic acid export membrane protein
MLGVWGFDVLLIPRYGLLGASLASSLGYVPALAAVYIGFLKYNDMSTSTFVAQTVSLVRIRIGGAASKPASP